MLIFVVAATAAELTAMNQAIGAAVREATVCTFSDPLLALRALHEQVAEDVLVSSSLKRITFMEFIRAARSIRSGLSVTVFSEKSEYETLARASGADAFLFYPPTEEAVRGVLTLADIE